MRTADVARAINCNVSNVRRQRQSYRETGRRADRPRSGRPCVTTPAQDRYIQTSNLRDIQWREQVFDTLPILQVILLPKHVEVCHFYHRFLYQILSSAFHMYQILMSCNKMQINYLKIIKCGHLQSKIKSRIGFLFRNKASFTHAAKNTIVTLNILPILDFGDVIYKIASNTLLSQLDAVHHSAIRFATKAPYTTHHCDLYALVGWPLLRIRRQTHWLQSLLGKAPPYLSSLVTITTPTRSTRSSRYISLVIPKANTSLAAFPSSSLLPMTGTNCTNH
ncbi:unnamed protein product [Oncorhynchus mykiss]|uniref:Uncharacterized protein n=1 Tax=Oncorhynchus mykiss TaxID=8022 RepID=A0A060WF26_ONCMY|nr:unnamed protein product [Oncorhynchus mykiss]